MAAYVEDTIAAIATPSGQGAIAILRLSGLDARAVAGRILRTARGDRELRLEPEGSHRARRAQLVRPGDSAPIDDVLLVPMWRPRSYTGEDTVEIHCHGGRVIADAALKAALAAGARAARPGEFTERAYLNGRLDLCQAEAVADMIHAGSEAALAAARRQLQGDLSAALLRERDRILDIRALVEAHLDFPEEDLPAGVQEELREATGGVRERLTGLAATFARGRLVRDGVRVVLAGKPNVGKSSLLNALLGRERALVSPEAGTTRDYLEEPLAVGPLQLLLCDTAGIRATDGHVERAGVQRSEERIAEADVLILVLDGSRPIDEADEALYAPVGGRPLILVRNKCDLAPAWSPPDMAFGRPCVAVSATRQVGLADLERELERMVPDAPPATDGILVTHARHYEGLIAASHHLADASSLVEGGGALELVAADLQLACGSLDELVGRSDNEQILDRIFSRFCVGK